VAPTQEIIQVSMTLASLSSIPEHPLPPGFSFRWFRPGDQKTWADVWQRCEKFLKLTPETFAREFGTDEQVLALRQVFLLDSGGQAVGTSTAWLADEDHGPHCGRIHWVAIVPEMQGRGLAKPLLSTSLKRMRELGYRSAVLGTHAVRIPAIKLYLQYGFVPEVRNEKERQGWRDVRAKIAPSVLDGLAL